MPSKASAAQIASGRDSSVTQLSSSQLSSFQLSSRASVSSNMGRRCAHDGCNRLSLTGGPKCYSHTPKPQTSPPIRGSAQMLSTDSLSPENVKIESASPRRTGTMSPAAAANRRSGESQYPPHPAKGLSHKSLPAKATARKSVAKHGQRREDSNSAAADESEIIVASDSTTSTNKSKASKRAHDNLLDSPRKKPRLGLSDATAEPEEPEPLTNGGTHKAPAKRLEQSASRPIPQPATTTATPAVSSASLGAAPITKTYEQSRVEPRGRETLLSKTQTSLDTSWHGKSKEGKLKKKMVRDTSVAESTSEKLRAGPPTASNSHPKEGAAEREKSNGVPPTQGQSLKKSGQGATSSTVEPNKGEKNQGHPVVLSLPKSSLGTDAVGASKSTKSSWQSTMLAPEPEPGPEPAVKKPPWTEVVGGQIGHKPTAQPQTVLNSHAPFALGLGLKGLVAGSTTEATQRAPSTNVTNHESETRNPQPAVNPHTTTKPPTSESQPIAPSVVQTKFRTEKATRKALSVEKAAEQVLTPAPQPTGMPSRPGVSTVNASSSTDSRGYWAIVHDTTQPFSRAPSFRDKETHPIARDVASSARSQSVSSQPIHTQERRPNTKNEHGQNPTAAPRQPIPSKHSMRTTEVLSHVLEKTKSGMKAPVTALEDTRGLQGHHSSSTYPQRKEVAFKRHPENSEHSSALPQRTKGHSIRNETVAPRKHNRLADQVGKPPEKTELPAMNGVASTAKLDTTGTQLRKEENSGIETAQPPRNSPMVIDLVSSDSESPVPSKTLPKTTPKTEPLSNESQEARPGLRMPSVNIGPIPTLNGIPPNPGPSANGLGEPRQVSQKPLSTGESISTGLEGKAQISQKPSASSDPVATMSGHKTSGSDKPLFKPSHRWTNVTPERWRALSLAKRRQMLQDQHDESKFDEFIYGPTNAANHPRPSSHGKAPAEASPRPKTAPPNHFRHFDPRVHWTHARPKEWHERKQKEIADRGNRKAPQNFGRAAARRAQLKASVRPRKVDLPERVEKNPKWVAALAELDDMAKSYHEEQRAKARLRKKRKEAAKDRDGDTEMQDVPPETPDSAKDAPVIGGMRRPLLEVMIRRRWRKVDKGVNEG